MMRMQFSVVDKKVKNLALVSLYIYTHAYI